MKNYLNKEKLIGEFLTKNEYDFLDSELPSGVNSLYPIDEIDKTIPEIDDRTAFLLEKVKFLTQIKTKIERREK